MESLPTDPLVQEIQGFLQVALRDLGLSWVSPIVVERPAQMQHGDYASPLALHIFSQKSQMDEEAQKTLLQWSSPRTLAQALAERLPDFSHHPHFAKVDVAGAGFINFSLNDAFLSQQLAAYLEAPPILDLGNNQTVVVEYSSPNIAKPFTVGHLRSTIIGDAIANMLEASGYDVKRDNHLGDWGTQFGKQIYAIKKWSSTEKISASDRPVKKLVELYVKFHQEAEKDPSLEDEARAWFKKLEDGDHEARELWQKCIDWSWKEFSVIYDQLGVKFTENGGRGFGESFFEDKMAGVIDELKQKNLLQESEDAQLVFFPNDEFPPLMILKKDGSTLYATRDLATDHFRLFERYSRDTVIINEVGAEQSLYFQQLFKVEEMLGWVKPGQRVHMGHGFFRFKEGKMSTRKGNVVWLEDVLNEAVKRAQATSEKNQEAQLAHAIGIGALKWNDLKRKAVLDVVFDWDEILNMQGNSGPYMQYTAVRAKSVLEKGKEAGLAPQLPEGWDPAEQNLVRWLLRYPETVVQATLEYAPHRLSTYLYNLAQQFNGFYNSSPIIDSPRSGARLALTQAVLRVVEHGLGLLGIATVEYM